MGRIFLEHMDGSKLFNCRTCNANLTTIEELISDCFTGPTGPALLFNKVVNLTFGNVQEKMMLTGNHFVRDVFCKRCEMNLGWIYEFAEDESQRYKEGKVVLEKAFIVVQNGMLI